MTEATSTTVDLVSGMSTVTSVASSAWDLLTSNPLAMVFVAVSLLGVGFAIFKKIKKSAK